jgi:hypothetical protein
MILTLLVFHLGARRARKWIAAMQTIAFRDEIPALPPRCNQGCNRGPAAISLPT